MLIFKCVSFSDSKLFGVFFCFGKHGEHFGRILSSHLGMRGEHFVCGVFNLYKMGSNLKKGFKVLSVWFFNLWIGVQFGAFMKGRSPISIFIFILIYKKNLIWSI